MARDTFTDRQWERLHPLLPPQQPQTWHPAKDHQLVLNGMLWVLRTGVPWQTLATRFYGWVKAGIWDQILAALQRQADAEGEPDWTLRHVDGSVIRAHRHAARARKGISVGPSA
jgi:transposase